MLWLLKITQCTHQLCIHHHAQMFTWLLMQAFSQIHLNGQKFHSCSLSQFTLLRLRCTHELFFKFSILIEVICCIITGSLGWMEKESKFQLREIIFLAISERRNVFAGANPKQCCRHQGVVLYAIMPYSQHNLTDLKYLLVLKIMFFSLPCRTRPRHQGCDLSWGMKMNYEQNKPSSSFDFGLVLYNIPHRSLRVWLSFCFVVEV